MAITIDGTTGIAGVNGSASTPAIQGTDTNTGVFFGTDTVTIATGGTAAVTVDSGQRTKFPTTIGVGGATPSTSGSGVSFPATQSSSSDANTLDDYEEGTWTPVYTGSTGSIGSTAYSSQDGKYTKIGNVVTVWCRLVLSNKGSWTGEVRITGLPFTVGSTPAGGCQGTIESRTINFTSYATVRASGGTTYLEVIDSKDNLGSAIITTAEISDSSGFLFTMTYFV